MINNENKGEKQETSKKQPKKTSGFLEVAHGTVQTHLLIKDKDTGEVLLDKRT